MILIFLLHLFDDVCTLIISSNRQSLTDWIYMYGLLFHYLGICSLLDRTQCLLKGSCLVKIGGLNIDEYKSYPLMKYGVLKVMKSTGIKIKMIIMNYQLIIKQYSRVTHTHYNYGKKRERKTIERKTMPFSIIL